MDPSNQHPQNPSSAPSLPQQKPSAAPILGGSVLLADAFEILVRYCIPIFAIYFIPDFLVYRGMDAISSDAFFLDGIAAELVSSGTSEFVLLAINILISFAVYSIETALFVLLAYDVKLGRPIRIGRYIKLLLTNFLPIVALSLFVLLLILLGLAALIVPGLWVNAVFIAVVPAIMTENVRFGALKRSIELTRDYRWPIAGVAAISGVISSIIDNVAEKLSFQVIDLGYDLAADAIYVAILTALIYVRLREIKEGIGIDQIAEIFD